MADETEYEYEIEWSMSYRRTGDAKPRSEIGGGWSYAPKTLVMVFEEVMRDFVNNLVDMGPILEDIDPADPEAAAKFKAALAAPRN